MLHKAWNSKGEMPYCFPRSSIKFQGHMVQNITDFDPNWAFPDYRPVAAFKSLRFALFVLFCTWWRHHMETFSALLALCAGKSPVTTESSSQRKASDAELWRFTLICAWTNGWVNDGDAGDLRRHRAHYDVTVMWIWPIEWMWFYHINLILKNIAHHWFYNCLGSR